MNVDEVHEVILLLSPKILPCVFSEVGSMASTATLCPVLVKSFPNVSIKVLFPTPGTPVIPILIEFPECDKHFEIKFCAEIASFSKELSKRVIPFARATLLPFIISLNKSIYFTAITEISTFTFFGNTETSTASLAGGFWEK